MMDKEILIDFKKEEISITKEDQKLFQKLVEERRAKLAKGTIEDYLKMLEKMKRA